MITHWILTSPIYQHLQLQTTLGWCKSLVRMGDAIGERLWYTAVLQKKPGTSR